MLGFKIISHWHMRLKDTCGEDCFVKSGEDAIINLMTVLKPSAVLVKDIMSTDVISVDPETSLVEAGKLLSEHNFDGLPVVDKNNTLLGIITEYDLVSKSASIHLPTFQFVLQSIPVFGKDKSHFDKDLQSIFELKVGDVMNTDPLFLEDTATYEEAVDMLKKHHRVNPIPIVKKTKQVVGVVSRFDVLKPLYVLKDIEP